MPKNKVCSINSTLELQELEKSITSRLGCWHWCLQALMCHCKSRRSDGWHWCHRLPAGTVLLSTTPALMATMTECFSTQAQGEQTTSDGASNIWVIYFMLALSCNEKSFSPHKWNACLFFVFMVQWKPHWREAGNLFFSNWESVPCVRLRATDCVWKCLVCGMS